MNSIKNELLKTLILWLLNRLFLFKTQQELRYKIRYQALHQKIAASTWWYSPRPRLSWVEMAVGLPEGPSHPGHSPHTNHFFTMLPSERTQKVSTQAL